MVELTKKLQTDESVEGLITFVNYDLSHAPARAYHIDKILRHAKNIKHGLWRELVEELGRLTTVKTYSFKNRVVLGARTMQAGRLIGVTTYTGIVNYGALGTGSTAVTDADSVLDTEVKRKQVASTAQTNDQVSIDFYYSKSDTNGTYQEFGLFIDGTSTVDTGLMFNRALTGGWTKSSLESMTVSIQININAV